MGFLKKLMKLSVGAKVASKLGDPVAKKLLGSKKKPNVQPSVREGSGAADRAIGTRRGPMAGYTGPKVGSAEWKAARARGETPVKTYLQGQRAAKKTTPAGGFNTGVVPPGTPNSRVPNPLSKMSALARRTPVKVKR